MERRGWWGGWNQGRILKTSNNTIRLSTTSKNIYIVHSFTQQYTTKRIHDDEMARFEHFYILYHTYLANLGRPAFLDIPFMLVIFQFLVTILWPVNMSDSRQFFLVGLEDIWIRVLVRMENG